MSDVQGTAGDSVSQASSQKLSTGENEQPSPMCLLRVRQELARMIANPLEGVYISPDNSDASAIHALMLGPADTPYNGGFFHFVVKCMRDYPTEPPRVRLIYPGSEEVQFNAQIYDDGLVCLNILGTSSEDSWEPSYTMGTALLAIHSRLNKNCGIENARSVRAVSRHRDYVEHETVRVAVCDMVEDCMKDTSSCPAAFRDVVLKKFLEFYSKYEGLVKKRMRLNGFEMKSYLGASMGNYQYERLLARLQELQELVRAKVENLDGHPNSDLAQEVA